MRPGTGQTAVASDFLLSLDDAMNYARGLLSDLDFDLARARASGRDSDREFALLRAHKRIHAITRDLTRARARASSDGRIGSLSRGLIRDRNRASAIALAHNRARILSDVDDNLGNAFDLAAALTNACTLAAELRRFSRASELAEQYKTAPLARRLLAIATQFLPGTDQARYCEEFTSELTEIARAGGRHRAQLTYAARQMLCAWRLRAELTAPRRRGAVQ